jgi:RHS repeat-associated protein
MHDGVTVVGHPVDVASGAVYVTRADISVRGAVRLEWQRKYWTGLLPLPPSGLGQGWTTAYFSALTRTVSGYYIVAPEGGELHMPDPKGVVDTGGTLRHLGGYMELSRLRTGFSLLRWDPNSDDIVRYVFDARIGDWHYLSSVEDVTGQGLDIVRDPAGRILAITQRRERRSLLLEYTHSGRISSIRFAAPQCEPRVMILYDYDDAGRLAVAYDALGQADRYTYDASGRLVRELVKDGGEFLFEYGSEGRCTRTSGRNGYDQKFLRYTPAIGWTEVKDSLGSVANYQTNERGQVVVEINAVGAVRRTSFDEFGRLIERIDPNGGTKRFEYDEQGNRVKTTDALGREYSVTFNELHQPLTFTNADGSVWRRAYDARHALALAEDPLGRRWTFGYDDAGNLIKVEIPGAVIRHTYRPDGVLESTELPDGTTTRYEFDAFGREVARRGAAGSEIQYEYDAIGRRIKIHKAHGLELAYTFDARGNLTSLTDRQGTRSTYRWGSCRRLLEATDPLGATIRLKWGTEPWQLLSITNEKGETATFGYDAAGRRVEEKDFSGAITRFEYGALNLRTAMINANGERVSYKHDAAGRTVETTLPDGITTKLAYDANGFLISAENPDVRLQFHRDAIGRIIREIQGDEALEYRYDDHDRVVAVKTSRGAVEYTYTVSGILTQIVFNGQRVIEFTRDFNGREVRRTVPGVLRLEQAIDGGGRLLQQRVLSDAATRPAITRTYDWIGVVVTGVRDNLWGSVTYSYDASERLLGALRTDDTNESFAYDQAGNLVSAVIQGTTNAFNYVPGNRVVRAGQSAYQYDLAGRLVRKSSPAGEFRFEWDAFNQLRSVEDTQGRRTEFAYDALGRRTSKSSQGRHVRYVWENNVVMHEVERDGEEVTWLFDRQTFKPFMKVANGSLSAIVCDHLGTPREMFGPAGKLVWAATSDVWGRLRLREGAPTDCPIRFQGQWHDIETGLHYCRHRYYDPEVGRFISPDPIGYRGGLNLYRYAPNPINWIDPLGLTWNYVIWGERPDGQTGVMYSGTVSDQTTMTDVRSRHGRTEGDDGEFRYDPERGDRVVQVTPPETDHDVARGLEQRIADEHDTIIGRRGSDSNPEGSVRGNLQDPVNQTEANAETRDHRAQSSQAYLEENETTTRGLVSDALEREGLPRTDDEEEEGC